jgi:hypothetical protein
MSSNPLLSKLKLPGRIFQLPSKGVFYNDKGILSDSIKDGEIEVLPLSALAEMKLRSPDLLFSGKAIREICQECIPGIIKPECLISKDIDAIFCFLRIVTFGNQMKVKSFHSCENGKLNEYIVDVEQIISNPNNTCLDFIDTLYSYKISNGQDIKLKSIAFQDIIDMTHLQIQIDKSISDNGIANEKLILDASVRDLMSIIESVDNISDQKLINEWVRLLPRKYVNEILDYNSKISQWGYNLNVQLKCKDCGEFYHHNLELDPINFFSG